jgi:hypothetical protein
MTSEINFGEKGVDFSGLDFNLSQSSEGDSSFLTKTYIQSMVDLIFHLKDLMETLITDNTSELPISHDDGSSVGIRREQAYPFGNPLIGGENTEDISDLLTSSNTGIRREQAYPFGNPLTGGGNTEDISDLLTSGTTV